MHNTSPQVEIIRPWKDFDIRYALFDFDGTISLIREKSDRSHVVL